MPYHTIYESSVDSSDDDDDNDDDENEDESNTPADTYGFFRTDKGWYSIETGVTYETHLYYL
jgi:hypothetical protein